MFQVFILGLSKIGSRSGINIEGLGCLHISPEVFPLWEIGIRASFLKIALKRLKFAVSFTVIRRPVY